MLDKNPSNQSGGTFDHALKVAFAENRGVLDRLANEWADDAAWGEDAFQEPEPQCSLEDVEYCESCT